MEQKKKILVVDDDPDILLATSRIVKSAGYDVFEADNGKACIDLAKKQLPDLILLDVVLPDIDGFQVCEKIKKINELKNTFIILISGKRISPEEQAKGLKLGADGYITRPFHSKEFIARIEAILRIHDVEKLLRESKQWLKTTLQSIGDAVVVTDENGKIKSINTVAEKITGWHEEEVIGFAFGEVFKIIDEKTEKPIESPVKQVLEKGVTVGLADSSLLIRKDKAAVPIADSAASIKDETGKVIGTVVVFRDTSEKRKQKKKLVSALKDWENMFQAIAHPTLILNPDHTIVAANNATLRAVGLTEKEIIGRRCCELFHNNRKTPPDCCPMETLIKNGHVETIEMEMEALNGVFLVSCTPVLDENGRLDKVIHIATEITDRKMAEDKLALASLEWRTTFDAISDVISLMDLEGNILRCNKAMTKFAEKPFKQLIGKKCQEIICGKSKYPGNCPFQRAKKSLKRESIQFSKNDRWYQVTVDPQLNESNAHVGFVHIISDITDRIQAESEKEAALEKLIESEDRLSKTMLAANDGMWDWDLKKNEVYFDPRYYKMAGYEVDEFPRRLEEFQKRVHPDNIDHVMDQANKHLQGEIDRFVVEFQFKKKDGNWLWILGKGVIVERAEDGTPLRFVGTHSDISDRKQAEIKLQKSEQFLQDVFEAIQDGISVLDTDLNVIKANAWMENTYKDQMPLEGKKCYHVYQQRKTPCPWCPTFKTIDTGESHTEIVPYPSEKDPIGWIELSTFPIKDEQNRVTSIIEYVKDITDRKKAEQALRDSEARNLAILNALPDLMFVQDREGTYLDYHTTNPEALFIEPETFLGKKTHDIFPEEFASVLMNLVQRTVKTGKMQIHEYQLSIEEEVRHFEARIVPYGEDKVMSIIRDYTDQKLAEQAHIETELKYRSLIENSNDAIYLLYNRKFEIINKKFEQMFGYTLKDVNKPDFDFINLVAPESRKLIENRLKRSSKGEKLDPKYEFTAIAKDGRILEVEASVTYIDYKDGKATQGIIRDITERKRAVKALKENEEKLRNIVEHSTNLFYSHTPEHELTYLSPQSREFLQCEPEEAMVKWTEFATDNPVNEEGIKLTEKAVKTGKRQKTFDLELVGKKGKKIWVEVREAPVIRNGETVAIVGSLTDITDRKRAGEQIQRDLKEKTILLSEIHHRVKNSLQVVASLLHLQSKKITDKSVLEMFKQSRSRINMMASVYERLYRTKSFANINFKAYLEDVLKRMHQLSGMSHRISLKLYVKDVELGLDDAIPIALILNELFTNSMKYAFPTGRKGAIEISFSQLEDATYQLIYKDNGVGLPDQVYFNTTESLGLHLVKLLAEQIHGDATIEQNEWTTFKIIFKGYDHKGK